MHTAPDTSFFGHPRGLATLFFTEMWERFSYYGMRALLILFMTAPDTRGGLGFDAAKAGAIYGLYTAMVYLFGLPGGWIADRILGLRRAVLYGGAVIALGHFSMAFGGLTAFYTGLALIVIGTGLVKPNVSAMVGELYAPEDRRRDAGYSLYYMGINIGAFVSPLICGYVGEKIEWHYGFGLAGIGMTLGLIQYVHGGRHLGQAGLRVSTSPSSMRALGWSAAAAAAAIVWIALLAQGGFVRNTAHGVSNVVGMLIVALVISVFAWLLLSSEWTGAERKRFLAVGLLFIASAMFFSVFEQAGSSLNLFAERSTNRTLLGYTYPASWFQSINAMFIIALAPVLGWLWLRLGPREPSSPAKFVWALAAMAVSFFIMAGAALNAADGGRVTAAWLWATYLLHTVGELCLSPVGMSAFSKLAPSRVTGMMMGVWFLSLSVGNYMGGRVASFYETIPLPSLFAVVALFAGITGLVLAAIVKHMKGMMGGVS